MNMAAILFNGAEPFEQIVNIFDRRRIEVWRKLVNQFYGKRRLKIS